MTHTDIIRAWKDPEYRLSLGDAERTQLPAHPAGRIELTDAQLDAAVGGIPATLVLATISLAVSCLWCKSHDGSPGYGGAPDGGAPDGGV
jgi:mersacidin/lichenicidin family type 2 lantibiotic